MLKLNVCNGEVSAIYLEQRTLQAAIVTDCKQLVSHREERTPETLQKSGSERHRFNNYSRSNNYRILYRGVSGAFHGSVLSVL